MRLPPIDKRYFFWNITMFLNVVGVMLTISAWFIPFIPETAGVASFLIGAIFAHANTRIFMKHAMRDK